MDLGICGVPGTNPLKILRDKLSFWEIKSDVQIFDGAGVSTHHPRTVQGSAVFSAPGSTSPFPRLPTFQNTEYELVGGCSSWPPTETPSNITSDRSETFKAGLHMAYNVRLPLLMADIFHVNSLPRGNCSFLT